MKRLFLLLLCGLVFEAIQAQNFAKAIGGSGPDQGIAIKIDATGNIITMGIFSGSVDFDPGPGTFNLTAQGAGSDMFISKLDPSGNLLWAKSIGASDPGAGVNGKAVSTDALGNIYVTGYFSGTVDFDPGPGIIILTSPNLSTSSTFIIKLNGSGNLLWAKNFQGETLSESIVIDVSGNVYTAGGFAGTTDFDPGPSTYILTTSTERLDIFISKLDASGNFVWAKRMGGAGLETGNGIAIDAFGNVLTVGVFEGEADFDPGLSTYNLSTVSGSLDIFISKLDANGNFVWAKSMGGASNDYGNSIALDASGNVCTTGQFFGTADFDPGPSTYILTPSGVADIFISKLDANGNFIWAKNMRGNGGESVGYSLALDGSANIYTTGYFQDVVNFDPGAGVYNLASFGGEDIFISKLDASGNFVWAKQMGGTDQDVGRDIAVDASNNVYTTGFFSGTADFDPGLGVYNLNSGGNIDIFITKLNTLGTLPLRLLNFFAETYVNGTLLRWQTTGEINIKNFIIEKSFDGLWFSELGSIKANGGSVNSYQFVDEKKNFAIAYYRLKITDNDGQFTYSNVVRLEMTSATIGYVYPNPVNSSFVLRFKRRELLNTQAVITDLNGKKIKQFAVISDGQQIQINELARGTYLLQLADKTVIKIVKN